MSSNSIHGQQHMDLLFLYALQALPAEEASIAEAMISACEECRRNLETLRPVVRSFVSWPTDVLRPSSSLWDRVVERIATETRDTGVSHERAELLPEPEWEEAAPGISVKVLARDTEKNQVSMLVRLAPGTDYPPHCHAGVEELHLLDGVLMVDDKTLYPGDYIHATAGSVDHRVWSETGCTCVLITSTNDMIL